MRIVICDDEKQVCKLLKEKIERFFFNDDHDISIRCFENGEQLLKADLDQIDVLFLDMDMPGITGLDAAKEIRKKNRDLMIVFVTAYSQFVFESFKVDAFRYLLKPIKNHELTETLQAIQKKIYGAEDVFNFSFQNDTYSLRISDIIYFEGMRGKIWIYCQNESYRWRGVLKEVAEMFKENGFFQVHRSYVINMSKITKYSKSEVQLEGGFKVPISKYKWDEFQEEYIRFWSKIL